MATDTAGEEFITIVPVGENRTTVQDPSFVTVLSVGAAAGASEVVVRRPRGARLGLGLKFEGGSAAAEKVRRLLVQSCAEDSPAANACTPWGKLIPGDEILAIDGVSVSELTRIDCVRRLKDSDETLTLLVRHFDVEGETEQKNMDVTDSVVITKQSTDIQRPTTLPPPVPPRKLGKKNSFKDKQVLQTVGEQNSVMNTDGHKLTLNDKESLTNGQNGLFSNNFTKLSRKSSFDSHIYRQNKESIACLKKGSPEEVRRLVRRLSDGKAIPPEAEVYIDLLSSEWERCLAFADAESDDTGSSISTVVDRLGSMTSSVENSIPSTPIMQPKTIDIQKVLNCIENIDSNILKDMTNNSKFLEKQIDVKNEKAKEKNIASNGLGNHESHLQISEEVSIKKQQNDKNNNNTRGQNLSNIEINEKLQIINKVESKPDSVVEKPKPMPRSVKVERSFSEKRPRYIPVPETPPPSVPETLLTPTKKNCIESWLQRSEAEMNNKTVEKLEVPAIPEVLPRLIDFVPKPQFKECTNETPSMTRPTAPPPPPPVESREDGSGASLDTIGELDESTDVTDAKPLAVYNETNDRKSSFERTFWEDRVNKSDAEDKSLSNDETPPPSCPRQPPDGVETPSEVVEKPPETTTRLSGWSTTRTRYSYSSRTQDARSEASVKDKIAMFSNDHTISSDRLDKCGTQPTRNSTTTKKIAYTNNYTEVTSLDRRLTKSQDNLDELPRTYKRHANRPEVLGALENVGTASSLNCMKSSRSLLVENKPLFYGSTATLPIIRDTSLTQPIYHVRSVSDDNTEKKTTHKSNLEYLIEQRKKSMSKLRGLVIPEAQAPIVDLPEIKVQDSLTKTFLLNTNSVNSKEIKTNNTKSINLNETKWKTNILSNDIPKYSPAFKRKSLQVYTPSSLSKESTPERKFNEKMDILSKINYKPIISKPLTGFSDHKNGINRTSTTVSKSSASNSNFKMPNKDYKELLNEAREFKNVEIKICTAIDVVDSDNDSAMSSTQSSYRSSASSPLHNLDSIESDSSRISPRISHYTSYSLVKTEIPNKSLGISKSEQFVKRNVCRSVSSDTNVSLSSSAGSAATSGSQASCSSLESSVADSDKRKVSKAYNIDTINRKNILASAKCRSGRDAKLTSPVIETKFSHESYDRVPSPTLKSSERLSTLTPSVSAISNKGENRRRNKIIAETDSDSDSEINVRQRKTDYKNTRLKRNSSSSHKSKQNEINVESPKIDEGPKCISEKIIKEIKKAGLDDFTSNKVTSTTETKNVELNKTEHLVTKKDEKKITAEFTSNKKKIDTRDNVNSKNTEKPLVNKSNIHDSPSSQVNSNVQADVKIPTSIIRLKRGAGSGVGLILAGGTDCEAKDVTVHRVLADSVAAKAGLKRGAKVRSINGYTMNGLTHAQSVAILKEQRPEVIIEIENEIQKIANGVRCGSESAESKVRNEINKDVTEKTSDKTSGSVVTVLLEKAGGGAGLGFGLDGGRDSPQGDRPLTIKKLFAGGAAAQSGRIVVGAELLSAGGQSVEAFTRTQAWAALKSLPAGPVTLVLRNPKAKVDS